jgi:hypothetical protein
MTGISAAIGVAGAVGSAVAPSLFAGTKGTTGAQQGSSNTSQQSGPALGSPYLGFENQILTQNIAPLLNNAPFNYDINSMFAPFNGQQQTAFQGVNNAAGSYQPWLGAAGNNLGANNNPIYNPTTQAAGAFGNAQGTPSALSQANPLFSMASQSTPSVLNNYLSPDINNVIGASDQIQGANFANSVMPALANSFVASGGGLGSKQYGEAANMALTNLNQNIGNTNAGALQNAFNASTTAAQNDLSRYGTLGSAAGNLALGQMAGYGNLGTQIGNNAALGNQTNIANAGANTALGTSYLNNGLTAANAQLQIGNQQQQQAQLPLTAAYNQALQQYQSPYQNAAWASNVANQFLWPTQTNSQTNSSGTSSGLQSTNSNPLTTGLQLGTATSALQNSIGQTPGGLTGQQYGPPSPVKRGGYFKDVLRGQGYEEAGAPPMDSNPGYWGDVTMARGGYAPHGQGNYGVGKIPHMARKGIPGDPYFSADGGMKRGGLSGDDLYHRFMFAATKDFSHGGFDGNATGGPITAYQGGAHFMPFHSQSPLITLDPHYAFHGMPHPGDGTMDTPSVPGFDHNPGYWGAPHMFDGGIHMSAGGFAPTVKVGRTETRNEIEAYKQKQAALERQQAAIAKPLQFRTGGYFSNV